MSAITSSLARTGRTAARAVRSLVGEVIDLVISLVRRFLTFTEDWLVGTKHAPYGLAITRILLGLTALGLLATNFRTRYYAFGSGSVWNGEVAQPLSDFPQIPIFSLFHRVALNDVSFTILYLALAWLAVLFTLGWRTKIVLPIFFVGWVSFIEMNDSLGDQGDNMFRITLLALLFADTAKRWSLDAKRREDAAAYEGSQWGKVWRGAPFVPAWLTNLCHNLVLVAVAAHVCFVYASGALYKAGGAPWQHGYAIYNPIQTQRFGAWPELSDLITAWAPVVSIISWTSIILQMAFPLMLLWRPTRVVALFGITSFHVGIAVLMGLPWFSLAMIAIDAIFIRDVTWKYVTGRISSAWRDAQSQEDSPPRRGGSGPDRGPAAAEPATERVPASG